LPNAVKDDVEKALRKERDVKEGKEDFSVILSKDLINTVNSVLGVLQIALVGVAGISLVVGALGIMNTMYTAVAERTKEIGIMKAIGATNHDITMIFLIESGMLGLFGGIIGDILGFSLSKIVEIFAANTGFAILKAYMSVELVVASLVFSFLIGALSGVLPARHAASLKPAEAIRK
jgi:putative ABC transport system permease protein